MKNWMYTGSASSSRRGLIVYVSNLPVMNHARDQLLQASQSIPLNIAEGNAKMQSPDRQRFLRIAMGSALECAAILDVLSNCFVIKTEIAL